MLQQTQFAQLYLTFVVKPGALDHLNPLQKLLCVELERFEEEGECILAINLGSISMDELELKQAHFLSLLKQVFPQEKHFSLNIITRPTPVSCKKTNYF